MIKKLWKKISYTGIYESTSNFDKRSVLFVNRITVIILFFVFTSIIINLVIGSFQFVPVLSSAFFLLLSIYLLNLRKAYFLSKTILYFILIGLLSYMTFKAGFGSGLEFYFLSLTVLPVIIFREKKFIVFFQALCILALIAQKFFAWKFPQNIDPFAQEYVVFYTVNSIYSILLIVLAIMFFRNINLKHEKHLTEVKEKLETSNQQLDSFVYSVSHDLRTPLRGISGLTNILKSQYSNNLDAEGKDLLQEILNSSTRMNTLINDLLQLSRSGKHEMQIKELDMDHVLDYVLHELDNEIKIHNTKIIKQPLPGTKGDPVLIQQVLMNLVSNAVKYSSKISRPKVEIGSNTENGINIYFVKDNGAGFEMKYAKRLFQAFERLHNQSDFEGTGIGLAIVKNNIQRHGGKVWAEAKTGEGATFYFSLPA